MNTSPMDEAPIPAPIPYASVGKRLGAYLIDGFLPLLLVLPGYVLVLRALFTAEPGTRGTSQWGNVLLLVGLGLSLLLAVVQWHGVATKGQSIGKRIVGIRVVDAHHGQPVGWGRALLRYLVLGALGSLCGLLLLAQAFVIPRHLRRQGWHDSVVNTVVLEGNGKQAAPPVPVRRVPTVVPGAPAPLPAPPPPPVRASLATGAASAPPPGTDVTASAPSVPSAPSAPSALTLNQPSVDQADVVDPANVVGAEPVGAPRVPPPPGIAPPAATPEPAAPAAPAAAPTPAAPVATSIPAAPVVPSVPGVLWRLVTEGTTVEVDGTVVIGRQPSATAVPGATTVAVDDPQRTMSKTHAVLRGDAESLSVEDLSSTNGVHLVEGTSERRIPAHTVTALTVGQRVTFGDCAFVVERAR